MVKRVIITQSNYIPWRGFFRSLHECNSLILLDDVQYTRRDWRNRNRIKTPHGPRWLTISVDTKGKYGALKICDARITDSSWSADHLNRISDAYRWAPEFERVMDWLVPLYDEVSKLELLSDVNRSMIESVASELGFQRPVSWSWDHYSHKELAAADPTRRLVMLAQSAGATEYWSGPAAKAYLDTRIFEEAGIEVRWIDHSPLEQYQQLYGRFESSVSVLDTMMMGHDFLDGGGAG